MTLSFVLNVLLGHYLKSSLSEGNYSVAVDATYTNEGNMQLLYDTGNDFNIRQHVNVSAQKGKHILNFPFQLKDGEQLRHIRLDFGSNVNVKEVTINSVALARDNKTLFRFEKEEIIKKLGFLASISEMDDANGRLIFNTTKAPFDPYIVFNPVNELINPKWQRTLLLVLPWLVLLLLPLLSWFEKLKAEGAYGLLFIGLFVASIPLKIAWVTFTSLLLMAYALLVGYQKRSFQFGPNQRALMLFFLVPFLFLGEGDASKLAIPLGFVIFALIGALVDFSDRTNKIKKIYITVFFVVMSISITNWLLLMLYNGYYYNIGWANYFTNVKSNAHATMYWLYYPHTTFLSFFILIGGLFCLDVYGKGQISKFYGLVYAVFSLCALVLLGSRFALLLGIALPFLYHMQVRKLSRWLIPIWAAIFTGITYFIGVLDVQREQLWKATWTAFKDKIWLGHGTGASNAVLPDHLRIDKGGIETLMKVNHSHNQFLTYLLENGLLGTLLFLAAFFYLFHQFTKQGNKTMMLISFMMLLLMIIESPFRTTTSLYVIAFLLSVFHTANKKSLLG